MGLMEIRRRMLMGGKKVIDTSPKILQYGVRYITRGAISEYSDRCITDKYQYEAVNQNQTLVTYGVESYLITYKPDGSYLDYWTLNGTDVYSRNVINANSGYLACTLNTNRIDVSYAYLQETGQILFAGKNSPYYGYTNINDMPT